MTITPEIARDMLYIIYKPIARNILKAIDYEYTIDLGMNDLFELEDTLIDKLDDEDFGLSIGLMEFRIIKKDTTNKDFLMLNNSERIEISNMCIFKIN